MFRDVHKVSLGQWRDRAQIVCDAGWKGSKLAQMHLHELKAEHPDWQLAVERDENHAASGDAKNFVIRQGEPQFRWQQTKRFADHCT